MWDYLAVAGALIIAMAVVWVSLRYADLLRRLLRDSGTTLLSRIAGMLLAAIAVQMIVDGVMGFVRAA